MDAAASSIKRDGIGCTSKLEQTLFDDMNGLCRELMAEVVGLHYGSIRDFTKSESHVKEDSRGRARLVCIMADGTGIPMRKECLQGAKGASSASHALQVGPTRGVLQPSR